MVCIDGLEESCFVASCYRSEGNLTVDKLKRALRDQEEEICHRRGSNAQECVH